MTEETNKKPDKNELIKILDNMIEGLEELPPIAMNTYVNNYDLLSVLILFSALFKSDLES